jgi:hypothetical protein
MGPGTDLSDCHVSPLHTSDFVLSILPGMKKNLTWFMAAGLFAAIGMRFNPNCIDVNGLHRAASGDGGNEMAFCSNELLSG